MLRHLANSLFIFPSIYSVAALPAASNCKTTPSSPNWPSIQEWSDFNATLSGALLQPPPPAAPCHRSRPEYNPTICSQITNSFSDSQWHSDNPISTDWINRANYSCPLDASAPCTGDSYPVYVVNASTANLVQLGVQFAVQHNLRLNIKSTGHDFLGRSTQPKSLSIWTHYMRAINWHDNPFSPTACSNVTLNVPAVTVGSGTQMGNLYSAAADRGLMIVGAASPTVSVGGYLTGGGHSAMSPLYGLGADNVIEIQLISADGNLLVANECTNPDLFWAIRGGSPTFGVVTSFTIRAWQSAALATWSGQISTGNSDRNWEAVASIHASWPQLSSLGASGYIIGNPYTGGTTLTVMLLNATSQSSLSNVLSPILSAAGGADGSYAFYNSYAEYVRPTTGSGGGYPGIGQNKLITSWLWDEDAVKSANLKAALMNSIDSSSEIFQDLNAGPGTHDPPFLRGGGNAANPAWRTAIMRVASEKNWQGTDRTELSQSSQDFLQFGQALSGLAPTLGSYNNEADVNIPDFADAFYGTNYQRLLSIKNNVDPNGVFWCKTCVGSEQWAESSGGELCSTS